MWCRYADFVKKAISFTISNVFTLYFMWYSAGLLNKGTLKHHPVLRRFSWSFHLFNLWSIVAEKQNTESCWFFCAPIHHQCFHLSISTAELSVEIMICLLLKKLPGRQTKQCKKLSRFSYFIATSCFFKFHIVSKFYTEISAWVCLCVSENMHTTYM